MPYSHTTLATLRGQLAARLDDSANIFWVSAELDALIAESLRTFGLLAGFWRERAVLSTVAGTAFYAITAQTYGSPTLASLVGYTVTDRNLVRDIEYHLLEPATDGSTYTGTAMFTLNDLRYAIQRRRDQFLADTGCVVTRSTQAVASPPSGRQQLTDTIIDVRRAAWQGASPYDYYTTLWREDERLLTAAGSTWNTTSGTPEAFSIMAPPPLQLQLAPPPQASGTLELLTVDSGAALDPATSATVLGIPDDLTPGVKWGALCDLLSKDGPARDLPRAAYCQQRYEEYVALARLLPVIIHAEVQGVSTIPCTLQELESSTPNWENGTSTPSDVAIAAPNMIALNPVPDGVYSVTLDVVRKTPVPTTDATQVQIGREQLDAILDYAEHLALFKVHGAEWNATKLQAANFLKQAVTYNQRLSASARAVLPASMQSQREKAGRPRRIEAAGIGALKGG